ncbi:MAG: GNAT family N-acetyltransferase [Planctomycetaceae bacterium]|nr:GNAT family N-acetyltransferase [Planctomycetaceae bacterium]
MLRIQPATGERLQPALELLFSSLPADVRSPRIAEVLREIEEGDFDPQHLLLAKSDSVPVGVQLTVIRDDDVGMVWPPVVAAELNGLSSEAIEDALLCEAVRGLDATKAWIGQSLLEPAQTREHAALRRNGFTRLTELRFFERMLADTSDRSQRDPTVRLKYEPYRRSRNRIAFANLLEATYRGTLDCPEFNGVRDGQQSLKNHEAAGSFSPDMWRIYRRDGGAVGVLLLVERADQQAWEVLYVGVVEEARRSGIGRAMLLDALQAARDADAKRLLIVADARNLPAVVLYESLGFLPIATRVAFVRLANSLPSNRPDHSDRQQ